MSKILNPLKKITQRKPRVRKGEICGKCGFRIRGKKHNEGDHHKLDKSVINHKKQIKRMSKKTNAD